MKESPIIFSTPMVKAILKGKKTQTRRIVHKHPLQWLEEGFTPQFVADPDNRHSPYGYSGDTLWVRETWSDVSNMGFMDQFSKAIQYEYKANCDLESLGLAKQYGVKWKPSIHMPRLAARLFLKITDIRVERLQDIGEQDVIAEGVDRLEIEVECGIPFHTTSHKLSYIESFIELWDSINIKRAPWESNPWVWVISFERIENLNTTT